MNKQPSAQAEELAKKLQEKLKRNRPRWLPLVAAVLLGAMAVGAWLLYPGPPPTPLTVAAMDVLAVEGEPVRVRAFVCPVDDEVKNVKLAGIDVNFWIEQPGGAAETITRKSATDVHGLAAASVDLGAATKASLRAAQAAPTRKHETPDNAHVHVVPRDKPLLLVDLEETLADIEPKQWSKKNSMTIGIRPGAVESLQSIRKQDKLTIVYFAVGATPAREYRRPRGWLLTKAGGGNTLPDGPVLGRLRYDEAAPADARKALLADLRERFTGPISAVVRTAEAAEQCVALKIGALALGGGDFPVDVIQLKSWSDVPLVLGK